MPNLVNNVTLNREGVNTKCVHMFKIRFPDLSNKVKVACVQTRRFFFPLLVVAPSQIEMLIRDFFF